MNRIFKGLSPLYGTIFICLIFITPKAFAQRGEIWGGFMTGMASYKNYRSLQAYDQGFVNPERYGITGVYLNTWDGSFICTIARKPKFMLGDYLRIGVGLGYLYSNSFKYLEDNGDYNIGYAGVNGNNQVYSPGPVSKSHFGYWVDFNYGLQAQYAFAENKMFGLRYFYRIQLNPSMYFGDFVKGASIGGVVGLFGRFKEYSGLVDFDLRHTSGDYSNAGYFAITGRKHFSESELKFIGLRIERFNGIYDPGTIRKSSYTGIAFVFGATIS